MPTQNKIELTKEWLPSTCHDKWMSKDYKQGLVSVIIPTYNRKQLLAEAINSVWKQTYRPIELIIVDDSSTDGTQEFILNWKQQREDKEFLVNYLKQAHLGAQAARNLGLIESQGEYIQFLDSDDVLLPEKFQWSVEKLNLKPEIEGIYCLTQKTDENLNPIQGEFFGKPSSGQWELDLVNYQWHTSGPLYRRSILFAVGPWLETLTGTQDWEYATRIKLCGYKLELEQQIGSFFRGHQQGRIGVSGFNYKYTQSAELAYDYIVDLAQKLNKMNEQLGERFVRLYLTRALEYSSAGYFAEFERSLSKALALPSTKNIPWFLTQVCYLLRGNLPVLKMLNKLLVMRRKLK